MHWTPAAFYEVTAEHLRCTLCPHLCLLADGAVGECHVRRRVGARLETATFASAVRHLVPIERKPLFHFRPGVQALTLAAPGCSFRCDYCQNYRLSQFGRVPEAAWQATPLDPVEVVTAARRARAVVALSYSEPSLAAELTLALSTEGRRHGVDVVWKTNGFVTAQALSILAPALAAANVDLKSIDDDAHRTLTGASVAPVLSTLAALVRAGVWVEVSTPVIPGFNDDQGSLERLAQSVHELGAHVPWHLVRFVPEFRLRERPPATPAALETAVRIARRTGLQFVYVDKALGEAVRDTCCPGCGTVVVQRRLGQPVRNLLAHGACPHCERLIPGRWSEVVHG